MIDQLLGGQISQMQEKLGKRFEDATAAMDRVAAASAAMTKATEANTHAQEETQKIPRNFASAILDLREEMMNLKRAIERGQAKG